jgi:N-acetylmuramoyl-L-alanine amidase
MVKNISVTLSVCMLLILAVAKPLYAQSSQAQPSHAQKQQFRIRTVVIDAGHGGKDPGCHGKSIKESMVALKVALELGKNIKKAMPDVKVLYTRSTNKFVELHDRANFANKNHADLFISIHCNSNNKSGIRGTETYAMGLSSSEGNLEVAKRENSVILQETDYKVKYGGFDPKSPLGHIFLANYQSVHMENSLRFADKIENQFKDRVGRHSRGVKQAGFIVLWKTAMPSVLVEIGFLTNETEEKYLSDTKGQSFIASGLFRAFRDYKEEMEAVE